MADIVLVHGIAQEQRSAADLESEWLPSLAGGLENAGHPALADRVRRGDFAVRMAFYGNAFLTPDQQGLEPAPLTPAEEVIAEEVALDLLRNAANSPNRRDADEARRELAAITAGPEDAQGLVRTHAVRAIPALDRIPGLSRGSLAIASLVKRTLTQVTRYLNDPAIRSYAIGKVHDLMTPNTLVVIGHSLGSVVAYEAVRAQRANYSLPMLLTLGSPLGLSAVTRRLRPQPPGFPGAARHWVNIAAPDDVVAAQRNLKMVFDHNRPTEAIFEDTWTVDNGSRPHSINFYLTKRSSGQAVADGLYSM
jgi:hypothetical protein